MKHKCSSHFSFSFSLSSVTSSHWEQFLIFFHGMFLWCIQSTGYSRVGSKWIHQDVEVQNVTGVLLILTVDTYYPACKWVSTKRLAPVIWAEHISDNVSLYGCEGDQISPAKWISVFFVCIRRKLEGLSYVIISLWWLESWIHLLTNNCHNFMPDWKQDVTHCCYLPESPLLLTIRAMGKYASIYDQYYYKTKTRVRGRVKRVSTGTMPPRQQHVTQ